MHPYAIKNALGMAPFIAPFLVFCGFLLVQDLIKTQFGQGENASIWTRHPALWVYALQTLCCAAVLLWYWKRYEFGVHQLRKHRLFVVGMGLLVFLLWVTPASLPFLPKRLEGFDPTVVGEGTALFWLIVVARFLRLVIIVPLVEEIFWRGFLQRYLIKERFETVAFGTYSHLSFFGVALAFTLVHKPPDWPAAFICGMLYGWVAIRTKSLLACVLAHSITNLLLGFFIMATRLWGFW